MRLVMSVFISVFILPLKTVIPCFRDEHVDWLRSGTWAKDYWCSTESLQEVKRFGQRYPNFGICEGEGGKKAAFELASNSITSIITFSSRRSTINGISHLFLQDKAGPYKDIYPYVIQELRPTLDELGISTPEELGMDKV